MKKRARDLGINFFGDPGKNNAITDVEGVEVGYSTIIMGEPVSLASHQIRENWTAERPIRYTVWPAAMVRNFCFHFE